MKLLFREIQKTILQYVILPFAYWIFCYQKVDNNLVVFADARDETINFNSYSMYKEVKGRGYSVELYLYNFDKESLLKRFWKSVMFMKLYARAKYVFIYNYFLPVSSCNKRKETKVIQLWHASGLQKKFGYDAPDDLGDLKWINPTKNFDLVSVSSEVMADVVSKNWRLNRACVKALGHSRSDFFFEKDYVERCKNQFYEKYPGAKGKKIILWAPSFRGNDRDANVEGIEELLHLKESLNNKYYIIIKLHPHLQEKYKVDSCAITTEELYPVVDILVTDYSSVFYDYLLIGKKVIFFVPDYQEYVETRGMYVDYEKEFTFPIAYNTTALFDDICNYEEIDDDEMNKYRNKFIAQNDGYASKRILDFLEKYK